MFIAKVFVPAIPSKTSHARNFPAISRSFISKPPHGFVGVISLDRNFFGHFKRQIVGSSASFPSSQLPTTSSPDASTQTRNLGSPGTNYFAVVDSHAVSFSSVLQSWNACFSAGKYFHLTIYSFTCSILLIGVINFFLLGLLLLHVRFSNQFLDSIEWQPFFHAHNLVQIRINRNLPIPRQFDSPYCAINHPTQNLFFN